MLIASADKAPATNNDTNVPSSAELVRMLTPCARYSTTNRIVADDTMATATGELPSRIAGRVKKPSTANAKISPRIDRRPRHDATSTIAAKNASAQMIVGVPRRKSKNP